MDEDGEIPAFLTGVAINALLTQVASTIQANAYPAPAFFRKNIETNREGTGPFASFGSVSGSYYLRY